MIDGEVAVPSAKSWYGSIDSAKVFSEAVVVTADAFDIIQGV